MIRLLILGVAGRMGGALVRGIASRKDSLALAAAVERPDSPAIGRDAGTVAGIEETQAEDIRTVGRNLFLH